jgi:adenylate kinase
MNLILLGAPGAGKGTQGALLAEQWQIPRIATGDLLRTAAQLGTPLGLKAKHYMDAGELVPDQVMLELVREVLNGCYAPIRGVERGFILDGFPRTLPQAQALDRALEELGRPLDGVLVLEVPESALIARLSGRWSCPECGAVHNVFSNPPAREGECDACGAQLVQRVDDDAATVRRRLQIYREQTSPLIAYYQATDTPVHVIDASRPVAEVRQVIAGVLET